jgi:hypothetical protein
MSLIQAAQKYAAMKKSGLTVAEISEKTGVAIGAIEERLQLLTLTPEEQDNVRNNTLSYVQALRICEQRRREDAKKARLVLPQMDIAREPNAFGAEKE